MDVAAPELEWIRTGGVVAFGVLVLLVLRQLVPVAKALLAILIEVKTLLAALLERERMRHERNAARDAAGVASTDFEEEETKPLAMALPEKRRTPVRGLPIAGGAYHVRKDER